MMPVINIIRRIIFWSAIVFLVIGFYSLTIAQAIPVEFADWSVMHDYYDYVMGGIPVAVLLTLFGTIKLKEPILRNAAVIALTVIATIFAFSWMMNELFTTGFCVWSSDHVLYENKSDSAITIRRQRNDCGAIGYGGHRVVKLKPLFHYWYVVTHVDTTAIDPAKWNYVNKRSD
jgi:hypothetical protein